jgi:uncharacterized membrane protein YccC
VEGGVEFIDERAMPWIERNRVMVLGIALGVLVGVGAAVMIARRSRPRPLVARLRDATTSVGERLERPIISTIRSATDRISG